MLTQFPVDLFVHGHLIPFRLQKRKHNEFKIFMNVHLRFHFKINLFPGIRFANPVLREFPSRQILQYCLEFVESQSLRNEIQLKKGLGPHGRIKKKLMMKSPISQRGGPNDSQS